jgi:hypothetical protein
MAFPVELIPQRPLVKVEKSRTPLALLPIPWPLHSPTSFADYCLNCPLWEQQLILHARHLGSARSLTHCLSQGFPLYLCTGGAHKHVGSLGWVIATEDEILWDCTGSAIGWHANSFRSEALGHLSILVFLQCFIDFHQIEVHRPVPSTDTALPRRRPWIRAATDNQRLLQRIAQAQQRRSNPFPSDALRAEYDTICGIITLIQSLPFEFHWEHVTTGHQNEVVPTSQPTRME